MSMELTRQLASGQVTPTVITIEDREAYIHAYLIGAVLPDDEMDGIQRVRTEERIRTVRKLWNP